MPPVRRRLSASLGGSGGDPELETRPGASTSGSAAAPAVALPEPEPGRLPAPGPRPQPDAARSGPIASGPRLLRQVQGGSTPGFAPRSSRSSSPRPSLTLGVPALRRGSESPAVDEASDAMSAPESTARVRIRSFGWGPVACDAPPPPADATSDHEAASHDHVAIIAIAVDTAGPVAESDMNRSTSPRMPAPEPPKSFGALHAQNEANSTRNSMASARSNPSPNSKARPHAGGALGWWHDLPVRRKQLVVVIGTEALAFCVLCAIFAGVFVETHGSQLLEQARSELITNAIVYESKLTQMGFGYAGQAENRIIADVARAGPADEGVDAQAARAAAKAVLYNEIVRRSIDISSLVTANESNPVVIVSSFRDRRGEAYPLGGLIGRAIRCNQQVRFSTLISREELAREGAPIAGHVAEYALVRLVLTPVYTGADRARPQAILVAGDVVSGKLEGSLVQAAIAAFKSGHVAVFQRARPGCSFADDACYAVASAIAAGDSAAKADTPIRVPAMGLLKAAAAAAGPRNADGDAFSGSSSVDAEVVTANIDIGLGDQYSVAVQAVRDDRGEPAAFLVRATSHARAEVLLRNALLVCFGVGVGVFLASALLALWLGGTILAPLRALQETVEEFWCEDSTGMTAPQPLPLPLTADHRDEIGRLTSAFGRMSARISEAYARIDESRLRAASEESRTRSIIETSNDAVFVIRTDGIVISCNHSAVRMFGFAEDELLGHNIRKIMPPEIAAQHDSLVQKHVQSGRTLESRFATHQGQRKSGEVFPVELSVSELKVGGQHLFVGMLRDITERKEMERQIARERQRAETLLRNLLPPSIAERLKDMAERQASRSLRSRRQPRSRSGTASPLAIGIGVAAGLSGFQELQMRGSRASSIGPEPSEAGGSGSDGGLASTPLLLPGASAAANGGGLDGPLLPGMEGSPGLTIADRVEGVPVLFADIVNFTPLASSMDPAKLVALLNAIFMEFDTLIERYGLEKIKTVGDAVMVAGGVPPDPPAPPPDARSLSLRRFTRSHLSLELEWLAEPPLFRMARLALAMQEAIGRFRGADGAPFRIRVGIHVGTVIAGVIGKKKMLYDLWGDTVNVASRMESSGEPGRTQVSEAVFSALKQRFAFEDRGTIFVKGKGELHTYFLLSAKSRLPSLRALSVDGGSAKGTASPRRDPDHEVEGEEDEEEECSSPAMLGDLLERPDFPVWERPASDLPRVARAMLSRLGLIEACKVGEEELAAFVEAALACYSDGNPFHDAFHAVDAMQAMFCFLLAASRARERERGSPPASATMLRRRGGAGAALEGMGPHEQLALMVAALCHDLEHPAVSNAFLVRSRNPMALVYANSSPLERHHAFKCLSLLERKDLDVAAGLAPEQRARFNQLVLDTILATDMTLHNEYMAALWARFPAGDAPPDPAAGERTRFSHLDDRTLLAGALLKAADLANGARTFANSRHWAERIQREFFDQGTLEQELGLDVTPGFVDNGDPELLNATRQHGFLTAVAMPLYDALAAMAPEVAGEFAANVRANAARWRERVSY